MATAPTETGIGCWRELVAALQHGQLPPDPICRRIIAAAGRLEQEGADGLTLDAALGLSPAQWRRDRRRRRNALIVEARDRFLAGLSLRQAGKRIARLGRELQSGRIKSVSDGLTSLLRDAIAGGEPFPASGRQVENILAGRAK
jgi:hypothetical protein